MASTETHAAQPPSFDPPGPLEFVVPLLTFVGVASGIVGIVVGLRMALHATVVDCPDGTYFPAGTSDYRCFAHQHAGVGTAIVAMSLMLVIVIALAAIATTLMLERRRRER